jgi:ribose-phosphate pyrophosphokinase
MYYAMLHKEPIVAKMKPLFHKKSIRLKQKLIEIILRALKTFMFLLYCQCLLLTIQGFFDVPVDHLYSSSIFIPHIQELNLTNLTIAAPDMGGSKRANAYAKYLDAGMAICYKERKVANKVDKMTLIGSVEGRDVILIDDIIDTAGTITMAADMIMDRGAKSIRAFCTHPVLSGKAYERIENSKITELVVTDTIPLKQQSSKIKVLTVADLFADVVSKVHNYESISSSFIC